MIKDELAYKIIVCSIKMHNTLDMAFMKLFISDALQSNWKKPEFNLKGKKNILFIRMELLLEPEEQILSLKINS